MAVSQSTLIPWRMVRSWSCSGCGEICCSRYRVPLTLREWIKLTQLFGAGVAEFNLNALTLRRRPDRSCIFLYPFQGRFLCALQGMKPLACKLWPFKIGRQPRYGYAEESSFPFKGKIFHVYLDSTCRGITFGEPTPALAERIIPEFIEVFLGLRENQVYSTMSPLGTHAHPHSIPYSIRRI